MDFGKPGAQLDAGATAQFTLGPLYEPTSSLAADAQGNVYVTDPVNSVVRKITPDGQVSTPVGQARQYGFAAGALPGTINRPVGIAVRGSTLYLSMDNGVVQAAIEKNACGTGIVAPHDISFP